MFLSKTAYKKTEEIYYEVIVDKMYNSSFWRKRKSIKTNKRKVLPQQNNYDSQDFFTFFRGYALITLIWFFFFTFFRGYALIAMKSYALMWFFDFLCFHSVSCNKLW